MNGLVYRWSRRLAWWNSNISYGLEGSVRSCKANAQQDFESDRLAVNLRQLEDRKTPNPSPAEQSSQFNS